MLGRNLAVVLLGVVAACRAAEMDDCLRKDSISCVQGQLFREVRSFFDQDKIELLGGFSLVKDKTAKGRALEEEPAPGDSDAIEDYALERMGRLLEERKINWDFAPLATRVVDSARALSNAIPQTIKEQFSSLMTEEGRGKKKKLMKALLPFLIGLKMKLSAFMVIAYFVIALIAKKALLASLISLAIAGFIAIKKLLSQQHQPHHEVHEVGHGHGWAGPAYGGGYSGGGGGGWDGYDAHGAYSNNVAHTLAYNAQKPATTR